MFFLLGFAHKKIAVDTSGYASRDFAPLNLNENSENEEIHNTTDICNQFVFCLILYSTLRTLNKRYVNYLIFLNLFKIKIYFLII